MLPEIVRATGKVGGVEESSLPCPCLAGHCDTSENVIEELSWGGLKFPPAKPVGGFTLQSCGELSEQQNKRCDGRTSRHLHLIIHSPIATPSLCQEFLAPPARSMELLLGGHTLV